ncbi:MAG: glycosyltransferase [Actinomycetota bacterium]
MFRRLDDKRPFDLVHSESTSAIALVRHGVHRRVPLVTKFHGSGIAHAGAHLRRFRSGGPRAKVREVKGLIWMLGVWFQSDQVYRFRPCIWMVPSRQEFDSTRRSHFLKRDLGYVVPNGIDTSVFTPRSRESSRTELGLDDLPLFVCAGRLDMSKGTRHAIRALALLRDRGCRARLAILGSGPDREALEALTRELGVEQGVLFTGPQPHHVLTRYLTAADAFLFPSELNEAAPQAPLQALACGTPLIASRVGSVPELVDRPGENGLLVTAGDPESLASAMEHLLRDAKLWERLSRSGLARVRGEYTLEAMIERTVAVYEIASKRLRSGRAE